MEIRHAANPEDFKHYTTERLRKDFLIENLMVTGEIKMVYSHYDRVITGGAVPFETPLTLPTYDCLRADYFLERREIGILNTAGPGKITVDGEEFAIGNKECLYIGKGKKEVVFFSDDAQNPAHFFLISAPAHTNYPTTKMTLEGASPVEMGTKETANERTIYKFIHNKGGIASCQVVMGMTVFKPGSIWNTMPSHTHDRRMEVYLYFDMAESARVIHLMGEPSETRHLVVANEQAIISPPWSIHSGAGTGSYTFIWAMAGENLDFTDMDFVDMKDLK